MKRLVLVNDREIAVDGNGDTAAVEPGVYSVLWNGGSFEVRIAADGNAYTVDMVGFRLKTEVFDPRDASRQSKAAVAGGVHVLKASMPGKVIRVLVSAGQEVEAGQGLIVVEAMKMQNEMKAAKPGRVAQIHAKDGDTVAAGDALITIE
ncbi:MAG: biotin/lipoyl-containing protein [Bryobacteraceae bacterium]